MWLFGTVLVIVQLFQGCIAWPDPHVRSKGAIWPKPQYIEIIGDSMIVHSKAFTFESAVGRCEIIDKATARYHKRLFGSEKVRKWMKEREAVEGITVQPLSADEVLKNLTIIVDEGCTNGFPEFGMDESYKLNITSAGAVLKANQVWGALRGLESFAHLFFNDNTKIHKAEIRDYPRFPHRGILLDTSRHYLSVDVIKANIELMAQNKFNTFHWHIVDSESFPYETEVIPDLVQGAFSPNHIYTIPQIKDIINYARLRGIRVVPEFDTPGHTKSWGVGVTDLLTKCYHANGTEYKGYENLLDPTNSNTWDVLTALFEEIFLTFPDNYVHLGGDEAEIWMTECWLQNPNISQFMRTYGLKDGHALQVWYFKTFISVLHALKSGKNKRFLVWQEAVQAGTSTEDRLTDDELVAHVWKDKKNLKDVTENGYYAILSACWYLDLISSNTDWINYYNCDPQDFNGTEVQKRLVLGGEAALWGEWVDESNVIPRLWPRASAVAERLWSSSDTKNITEAWPRLYEMQCRMTAQGYPAQPPQGPGYCSHEYKINVPVYD